MLYSSDTILNCFGPEEGWGSKFLWNISNFWPLDKDWYWESSILTVDELFIEPYSWSRGDGGSSFTTVMRLQAGQLKTQNLIPIMVKRLYPLRSVLTSFATHSTSSTVGNEDLSLVKQPGSEVDCSPPPSANVKNVRNCTSTPLYVFVVWILIKHRDNFVFYFSFIHD
jgi:hypothetical protein